MLFEDLGATSYVALSNAQPWMWDFFKINEWNILGGLWWAVWIICHPWSNHYAKHCQCNWWMVCTSLQKHSLQQHNSKKFYSSPRWKALRVHVCWSWWTLFLQEKLYLDQETFSSLGNNKIYLVRHWKTSVLLRTKGGFSSCNQVVVIYLWYWIRNLKFCLLDFENQI